MNWYKKLLAAYGKTFSDTEFFERIKEFGVYIANSSKGYKLTNPENGSFYFLHIHGTVRPPTVKNVLKHLGIDYNQFVDLRFKPRKVVKEDPVALQQSKKDESYKNTPWYQMYNQEVAQESILNNQHQTA